MSKLQSLGFKHDTTRNSPLCRWTIHGIKVDVVPTDEKILGFSNRWYPKGIENRIQYTLPSSEIIFLFSIPYFLASKLEAYHSRGQGDPRTSTDIEDILLVMDGANEVLKSVEKADSTVRSFLSQSFTQLFKTGLFEETIEGIFARENSERFRKVRDLVHKIIALQ